MWVKQYAVDGEGEGGGGWRKRRKSGEGAGLNTFKHHSLFNPTHSMSEYSYKLETVVDHLSPLTTGESMEFG